MWVAALVLTARAVGFELTNRAAAAARVKEATADRGGGGGGASIPPPGLSASTMYMTNGSDKIKRMCHQYMNLERKTRAGRRSPYGRQIE